MRILNLLLCTLILLICVTEGYAWGRRRSEPTVRFEPTILFPIEGRRRSEQRSSGKRIKNWRFTRRRCDTTSCEWHWGSCSEECGGGRQSAVLTRSQGQCGSCNRPSGSRSCNTHCCEVNCRWDSWSGWQQCSRNCGGGTQSRSRDYYRSARCGGSSCYGPGSQSRSCNIACCPIHCSWGNWEAYGSCSQQCGGGTQTRSRSVAVSAFCGGSGCSGSSTESLPCNTQCCPVDCQWSSWNPFNSCSVSCGNGTQSRSRIVAVSASCGGNSCAGDPTDTRLCNSQCCPVDCQWSSWTEFNTCSVSCGGGNQSRSRNVVISASCGGNSCDGDPRDTRLCNTLSCPIHCAWENWAQWGECNVTCGGGMQKRKRQIAIEAMHGGIGCSGFTSESRSCNEICCPVACEWEVWGSWGGCSKSCGAGVQERKKYVGGKKLWR